MSVSFNYKLKNNPEREYQRTPCFSSLRGVNFSQLEFVKYFIDSKLGEEETVRYLRFLKSIFGENVSVVNTYPLITLTIDSFSAIDDFQRLIIVLCFYRYLDETYPVLQKVFQEKWKTNRGLFKALLNANINTMSVNPNHQLIDRDHNMKYYYKQLKEVEIEFNLDVFKTKFFSGEKHIKGWGFFLKNLG